MFMNSRRRQKGGSLLEPLIAISVLSFGLLGLAKFQVNMLSQTTDSQARAAATALSEDLLTQVRVDLMNAPCYTWPAAGMCGSPFAQDQTRAWSTRAQASLPGFVSATATMPDATKFKVTLQWTSKAFREPRTYEVTTDVRL